MSKRFAILFGVLAGWASWKRWRPRPMTLSQGTLADLARKYDRAGLGEVNDCDAHPYAVHSMKVMPQDRPGVDARFARGKR